ncbi:MAG: helicase C-terminal domain-containing protein [Nocardioides sp.]|uniref:helicase-associated domain-containing protein n=1 Tax=Nocardioides sp. TaxID=35761 RepID=UPI0039E4D1C9
MAASAPPRSLADQLRAWSDGRLAALLHDRPDLASPAPQDSAQLASRAAVRASLLRATDQLTHLELAVLEALAALGPCAVAELVTLVYADPRATMSAAERLVDLALAWESPEGLRALTGTLEGLGFAPGGSGLRPRSPGEARPDTVAAALTGLSPAARALLEHLDSHGGHGTTTASAGDVAATPAQELLAARLVLPRDGGVVVLPGEVAVALRGGRTTREPVDQMPAVLTSERDPDLVERTAAGAAYEAVRRIELLLDQWGTHPPLALRSGGLGVRDLKAAARALQVDESTAALLVEVAAAAGLLATGDADGEPAWLPTDAFDPWLSASAADRWSQLVTAWLDSPRLPALVGLRDQAGKARNALAPELSSVFAVESRRMTLAVLATLEPGRVLAAGTGPPSLVARVCWLRPRRPASRVEMIEWTLTEAATLGLTGLGALSRAARLLLSGDREAVAQALDPLLPEPVDHILVQADLTAVAPGPLTPELARTLHMIAEVESRGGATVYRFTPQSVRRAFDTGWSAAEVHAFLARVSRTAIPQPLSYLIDDVARTFGTIRIGHAEAFVRSDDEATLTRLLRDPRAAAWGLRRLAPTVVVGAVPAEELLAALRELGTAPVVEAPDGSVQIGRPRQHRARVPRDRRPTAITAARETAQLTALVTALRAGDRAAASRPRGSGPMSPADSLAALREAVEASRTVVIGYVDHHGTATERVVDPLSVEGGHLTAHDHRTELRRSFALHRVTSVRPATSG